MNQEEVGMAAEVDRSVDVQGRWARLVDLRLVPLEDKVEVVAPSVALALEDWVETSKEVGVPGLEAACLPAVSVAVVQVAVVIQVAWAEVSEEAKEEMLAPAAVMAVLVTWELASESVLVVVAMAVARSNNNNSNNSLLHGKLC